MQVTRFIDPEWLVEVRPTRGSKTERGKRIREKEVTCPMKAHLARLTRLESSRPSPASACSPFVARRGLRRRLKPASRARLQGGARPVVLVDDAHNTFHPATGRYQPFAELLRRDGYRVEANAAPFARGSLKRAKVLVISNAIEKRNADS